MQRLQKRKFVGFLLISLFVTLLADTALRLNLLHEFESRSWDYRLRAVSNPTQADQSIKIIVIDQTSLARFAEDDIVWPWPRELYAAIVAFLRSAGAKGVAFDMLYTESSHFGPEDDRSFAESLTKDFPVVLALAAGSSSSSKAALDFFSVKQQQEVIRSRFNDRFLAPSPPSHKTATLPLDRFLQTGALLGNVQAVPDSDGNFRHYYSGALINEIPVLSLPFALFNAVAPVTSSPNLPTDPVGRLAINLHGGNRAYPTFSAYDVIQTELALHHPEKLSSPGKVLVQPEQFKDAWVFVGPTAPGLLDLHPTPLDQKLSGVVFNAAVLDNLLHQNFVRKTGDWTNLLIVFIGVTLTAAAGVLLNKIRYQLPFMSIVALGFVAASLACAAGGYWIPLAVPLLALFLSALLAATYQYQLEGREHRFIRTAFRQYLSGEVIEQIVANPSLLALGGERREITIFFSDIASFTSISEKLDPQQLVELLNRYLSAMTDIILDCGGTLDKYVGDAILSIWNAPIKTPDHALRAVQAALRCKQKLAELQTTFVSEFGVQLNARIGINSGIGVVGNFGSEQRFDYTVIGDAVNLASRLEGANKYFKTSVLLSGETNDQLQGKVPTRKIADIQVVGKSQGISVWEPFLPGELASSMLELFEAARRNFEAGDLKTSLEQFRSISDHDPVSHVYYERISKLLHIGTTSENRDWTPIWTLTEK